MKISVSSYSFQQYIKAGKLSQLDTVRAAYDLGLRAIEFIDMCPEFGKAPTLDEQKEYAKLIRAEADKYGMDINAYTIGANLFKKGEDAEKDPDAVVNLILDGAEITCTVAPAIVFQNVYECGSKSEKKAKPNVDTADAGANLILQGENTVSGAYVAKIFKDQEEEKKLWKHGAMQEEIPLKDMWAKQKTLAMDSAKMERIYAIAYQGLYQNLMNLKQEIAEEKSR